MPELGGTQVQACSGGSDSSRWREDAGRQTAESAQRWEDPWWGINEWISLLAWASFNISPSPSQVYSLWISPLFQFILLLLILTDSHSALPVPLVVSFCSGFHINTSSHLNNRIGCLPVTHKTTLCDHGRVSVWGTHTHWTAATSSLARFRHQNYMVRFRQQIKDHGMDSNKYICYVTEVMYSRFMM